MKFKCASVALLVAVSAYAEFWDGNKLLSRMRGDAGDQAVAIGYIMGVSDAGHNATHCPPNNATAGQMEDIVKRYLTNNPAVRHLSADTIINRALGLVFPCQSGGRAL